METSKAVIVNQFGSYDVLTVEEFPLPKLEDNVEVEVEFGGVNFADLYTRQGLMYQKKLPFILGMECVGKITNIGTSNCDFQVGQRVICYDYHCGMYSKKLRVKPDKIYPLPDYIPFEQGAAIFVNYLTAYFSIIELGHLKPNETVLIISCGGGVGWAATQFAGNIENVTIIGTASPDKHEEVRKNGVDTCLTLNEQFKDNLLEKYPDGVDLILCTYGGPLYDVLESLLKPLGRIVLIGANNLIQNDRKLSFLTLLKGWWSTKNVKLEDLIVYNRAASGLHLGTLIDKNPRKVREALEKIFRMFEEEKLKIRIHEILPMEKIVEATKLLAERKNIGKVLLSMK